MSAAHERPPWADWEVFGDTRAYHRCCGCCDGYCPLEDSEHRHYLPDGPLMRVNVQGVAYLTDRRLAVRADLIRLECGDPLAPGIPDPGWPIPDEQPPISTATLNPHYVHWLSGVGLTVHGDPPESPRERQHVYWGQQHAGWLMPTIPVEDSKWPGAGMRWADIDKVRALAADLPIRVGGDPWSVAAALIHAAPIILAEADQ